MVSDYQNVRVVTDLPNVKLMESVQLLNCKGKSLLILLHQCWRFYNYLFIHNFSDGNHFQTKPFIVFIYRISWK